MSRTRPFLTLAAPLAVAALVLAGCSGGSGAAEPAATAAASAPAAANGNAGGSAPGGGQAGGGGTSGQVAQVGDATLQVRDDDGQTTVTWSDDTTFSATTAGTLADVTVGSCVTAITGGAPVATGATDGSTADSSGTAADAAAASTVTITAATDGECTTGFSGRGGGTPGDRPSGAPTEMPTGAAGQPGDAPTDGTGGRGGFGGFGGFTTGKVTAVDGSTLTVDAAGQDGTTTSKTVTVDSSTTYQATAKASAKALVVGACATVQGKADDKGAVAATRIVVSQATDGTCSTGFGGGFGGRGGQGGQDDTSTQGSADA